MVYSNALYKEKDPDKREKIISFFDRYLPLITEIESKLARHIFLLS